MSNRVIEIMDTTLRDGEQTSGVSFSSSEKLTLSKLLLHELKVNRIEIASARVSEGEFNAVKRKGVMFTPGISTGYWKAKKSPFCDLSSISKSNKLFPLNIISPLNISYWFEPALKLSINPISESTETLLEFKLVVGSNKTALKRTFNDETRKQILKILKKYTLTETVEIVHKLSNISKKDIYKMALELKND